MILFPYKWRVTLSEVPYRHKKTVLYDSYVSSGTFLDCGFFHSFTEQPPLLHIGLGMRLQISTLVVLSGHVQMLYGLYPLAKR